MKSRSKVLSAGFLAAAYLLAPPAVAQMDDSEDVQIRAERVVIEVDGDGRVLLDGQPMSDDNGAVMLRVSPANGEVEIEVVGPRRRHMVFHGAPARDQDRVVFRRGDRGGHPHFENFDFEFEMPHIPDVAPLLERFRHELGDPLRESIEEHREVADLERESRELARSARRADGAERSELEAELRTQLNAIFDKKLELRRNRVATLEEKLEDERRQLERRQASRDDIIERRLRSLMGEDDILDW